MIESEEAAPVAAVPSAPAERPDGQARARLLLAAALVALGGLILALNLGLLPPDASRVAAVAGAARVMGRGLGWLLLGDRLWLTELAPFEVARGGAQGADLALNGGTADVRLEGGSSTAADLITGELPRAVRPKVTVRGEHTAVRLEALWGLPTLGRGRWRAALAGDLPWHLDVSASTGNLELDLTALTPRAVRAGSTFGDVDLSLPVAGGADLELRLMFGDLTIHVPDGLGVKVVLQTGALAEVTRDERRFIQLAPREIGTPLYAVAARRCTVTVRLGTGRLVLK